MGRCGNSKTNYMRKPSLCHWHLIILPIFAFGMSGGAIAKKPCFYRSALQSDGFDCLRISWHQVNSLVAPSNFFALDLKHDALDGALGA